jgi:hypothetical protein
MEAEKAQAARTTTIGRGGGRGGREGNENASFARRRVDANKMMKIKDSSPAFPIPEYPVSPGILEHVTNGLSAYFESRVIFP